MEGYDDLDRLWGYTHWYYAYERNRMQQRHDLCALLIVPSRTPTLDTDVKEMQLQWQWHDLRGGYWELTGGLFRLYAVEFEEVASVDMPQAKGARPSRPFSRASRKAMSPAVQPAPAIAAEALAEACVVFGVLIVLPGLAAAPLLSGAMLRLTGQ